MDKDALLEVGRKIGAIETFYRTAIEDSTRFLVGAQERQFNSAEAILLRRDYGNPEEFMAKAESYRRALLNLHQEYSAIRKKFPCLSYFQDGSSTQLLESQHQISLSTVDEAISVLKNYMKAEAEMHA